MTLSAFEADRAATTKRRGMRRLWIGSGLLDGARNEGERLVVGYLILLPVLWMTGLYAPLGALMLMWLAARRWPRGVASVIACTWLSIGAAQALAAAVNWAALGQPIGDLPGHLLSLSVIGWVLAGLAIAVGAAYQLASPLVARAVAVMGLYYMVFGVIGLLLGVTGLHSLAIRTPVSYLLPDTTVRTYYFFAWFFNTDDVFGSFWPPRLTVFHPWPTLAALAGIAVVLISLYDRSLRWRVIGCAGGVFATVFSFSRAGWMAGALVGVLYLCLRLELTIRWILLTMAWFVATLLVFGGLDPIRDVAEFWREAEDIRPGSTAARALMDQYSWRGFLDSPMFGQGWIGASVHPTEYLPVGTHSSIYGLLYTGGAITFGAFATALALTLVGTAIMAFRNAHRDSAAIIGFGCAVAITAFMPVDSLFSSTPSCLFVFSWIGGTLAEPKSRR